MAEGLQRVSAPCKSLSHISWLTATRFDHQGMSSHWSTKKGKWLVISCNLELIFSRIVILRLLKLFIKASLANLRTRPDKIYQMGLTANVLLIHAIAFNTGLSGNIFSNFSSYRFCSMLIGQLINLRKVRTENLKFRATDLVANFGCSNHARDCFQAFAHHHLKSLSYSIAIWAFQVVVTAQNLQSIKTLNSWTKSVSQEW